MSAVMQGGAARYGAQSRALNYAILCSVVLHGVLLFAVPALRQSSKQPEAPPGTIVARLLQPQSAPAPSPSAPQVEPKPAPPVPEQTPIPQVAKPSVSKSVSKPSPIARPETKALPQPSPATPAPAAEPAPSSSAPPSAAPPGGPVVRAEPQPAPSSPSSEAPDAGSLAQYRLQLIGAARRYKRYPRVAMDNNWEGTAEITMAIGSNGMISSVLIKTSSGHEVLDQQALEMFKRAKPLVPIPAALRGKEFTIVLRAIYSLKEPDV